MAPDESIALRSVAGGEGVHDAEGWRGKANGGQEMLLSVVPKGEPSRECSSPKCSSGASRT